jgi:membrane protein YdbS with pleckstrin-like domain
MTTLVSFAHRLAPLHRVLGWVPFAWLLAFGVQVGRGAWQFGHLPRYGPDPDLTTGWLFWAEFSLLLMGVLTVPVWGLLTVFLLGAAPGVLRRNTVSVGLCLLGLGGYVGVRLWQPDLFAWVMD